MTYEQEDYKGYIIKIEHDDDVDSPNDWGNTDLFLTACHSQFDVRVDGFNHPSIDMKKVNRKYHVFPLIAYIHSGVALSLSSEGYPFNCPWDAGQVGYVFAEKKSWKDKGKAKEAAQSLLETWNEYLSGSVWGFIIEDEDGEHIDSCWGFYGDPDGHVLEAAKESVDSLAEVG